MCIEKYGVAPEVKVTGHTATVFPYIVSPLDYILHEILKNSMRYYVTYELSTNSLLLFLFSLTAAVFLVLFAQLCCLTKFMAYHIGSCHVLVPVFGY